MRQSVNIRVKHTKRAPFFEVHASLKKTRLGRQRFQIRTLYLITKSTLDRVEFCSIGRSLLGRKLEKLKFVHTFSFSLKKMNKQRKSFIFYQVHGGGGRGALHAQVFRRRVVELSRTFPESHRRGVGLAQVERRVSGRVATSAPRSGLLAAGSRTLAGAGGPVAVGVVAGQRDRARLVRVRSVVGDRGRGQVGELVVRLLVVLGRRVPGRARAVPGAAVVAVDPLRRHRAAVARAGRRRPRRQVLICGGESANFERFCGLDEAGQLRLWDGGLPLVHEVDDALDLPSSDVLEDDDGVLARVVGEDFLKVGAKK